MSAAGAEGVAAEGVAAEGVAAEGAACAEEGVAAEGATSAAVETDLLLFAAVLDFFHLITCHR